MKYKVGDKVRVRKDLILGKMYGSNPFSNFTLNMIPLLGKVVTIQSCLNDIYSIEGHISLLVDDTIEGLAEEDFDENTDNGNTIRPGYYKSDMGDVFDIAAAYQLDMPLGTAAKYILRAGKKDKAKEVEDLRKAIRCIERAIELREGRQ
jgi:hypothetical protein